MCGSAPAWIVAGAESTFGRRVGTPHNAWNWFWEGPCFPRKPDGTTRSPFDSWQHWAAVVSKFLKRSYLLKGYAAPPPIDAGGKPAVPAWLGGGIALACAGAISAAGFLIGRRRSARPV